MWPSISGVAFRIRSIRAWTLGSIDCALAEAGIIAIAPASRRKCLDRHGRGLGTAGLRAQSRGLRFVASAAKNARDARDLEVTHAVRPRGRHRRSRRASRPAEACGGRAGLQVRPPRRAQRAPGGDLRQGAAGNRAAGAVADRGDGDRGEGGGLGREREAQQPVGDRDERRGIAADRAHDFADDARRARRSATRRRA